MTGAREEILRRVRAALADVPAGESPEDVGVPRDYAATVPAGTDVRAMFAERVADYRAVVEPAADVGREVARLVRTYGVGRLVVPADLPPEWLAGLDGVALLVDGPEVTARDLDTADAVLTASALGIAETGTVVLDGGPGQGRRAATLVPDLHLCVVRAGDVVGSVPQALARLDAARPLTWISGPSATSDIELDRVEGVHGPRTLHVLLVG